MSNDLMYYRGRKAKPGMAKGKSLLITETRQLQYQQDYLIILELGLEKSEKRLALEKKIQENFDLLEAITQG